MSDTQRPSELFCETPLACHVADRALHQIGAIVAAFELGNLCLGQAIAQIEERVAVIRQLVPSTPAGQALAVADTRLACAVLETLQTRAAPNSYSNSKESSLSESEVPKTNSNTKEQSACQAQGQRSGGSSDAPAISAFDALRSPSLS